MGWKACGPPQAHIVIIICFYVALFSALEQTCCAYCSSVLLCWVPVGRLAALVAVRFCCAGFLWADWLRLLQFGFDELSSCAMAHSKPGFPAPFLQLCRVGYTTEGPLLPNLHTSVHQPCQVLRKVWVPIRLRKQYSVEQCCKHEVSPPQGKNYVRLDSDYFALICAGVSSVVGYKSNMKYNLS